MSQKQNKKSKCRTHPLYAVILFLIKVVYTVIYRPKFYGTENIPDKKSSYIIASNHISANDVIFMAWKLKQQCHFVAKEELMKNPFLAFFARIFGVIPIRRGGADVGAIRKAIDTVKEGGVLGIFPQGTRRRGAKPEASQFRSGIGMMAAHAEADVVPMFIKTKGYRIKPFRKIEVYFGKPIKYEEFGFTEKKFSEFNEASKTVAKKIVELCPDDGTTRKKASKSKKQKKAPVWVWFLCLVPLLSSGLFVLILADLIPFVTLDIFYDKPGGGIGWHTSGLLVLIFAMLVWGVCGFLYGFFRAKMSYAVISAHALPFLCTIVYTVCIIAAYFGLSQLADVALIASIGMGLFSYIDTFIYGLISLGNFGLYLDLIFMIFTFVIGYTIGKSRRLKA